MEYKRGHGKVARIIQWKLSEKFNLEKSENWYLHNHQTVIENFNHKNWYLNNHQTVIENFNHKNWYLHNHQAVIENFNHKLL